jgi:hypothetical protein
MLTEHAARNAAAKGKPYKLSDFAGLYLLVRTRGSKLWRLKYRLAGELMIATRTLRMRLSVPHTNALRGYLLSQPAPSMLDTPKPDTVRLDHAAQ